MNILFVDDQVNVLDGIASSIHFEDLYVENVRYATSAKKALEILHEVPIDLLFSDIEMPGEDGISLIRNAKELFPDIMTVMLTAHAEFEYAQESLRLGCFDYMVQPVAYEDLERVIRKARQYLYDRKKKNQLYEAGRRLKTGEMELLDGVVINLLSSSEEDNRSAMDMLRLLEFPVSEEKEARILMFTFESYRRSNTPINEESKIHKLLTSALSDADIVYPIVSLSTLNHHHQFVLLLFSATQRIPELGIEDFHRFFELLCKSGTAPFRCVIGGTAPLGNLRNEYLRVREILSGNAERNGVLYLEYDGLHTQDSLMLNLGDEERWKGLLQAGQYRLLQGEFENALEYNLRLTSNSQKVLMEMHQRLTHIFFDYLYAHNTNTSTLFSGTFSYQKWMSSFATIDELREALNFMISNIRELNTEKAPQSDIERAKNYIMDNISDPITVKNVADYICLSPEYFTKLFKKETGQNIKEYITLTKIEAAKDMLENSKISVGMVALELGYGNFSHFSQVFKKYENMTPSEYRSQIEEKRKS